MLRRKHKLTNLTIAKKLEFLEEEYPPVEKPIIGFIGKLSDNRYEVVEITGIGKVNETKIIINTKEEYFTSNPDMVVIHSEDAMTDLLKNIINDDYSALQIENEGMIK